MTGSVTPELHMQLSLQVREGQARIAVEARVDTGFSGYLTLPAHLIALLDLPYDSDRKSQMGNESLWLRPTFRLSSARRC